MEALPILVQKIESECPKIRPIVLPLGVDEAVLLKKAEMKYKKSIKGKKCAICGNEEDSLEPQLVVDYDYKSKKMHIHGIQFVCPLCKRCMHLQTMMNVFLKSGDDNEEIDTISRHFLLLNGHTSNDMKRMKVLISELYAWSIVLKNVLVATIEFD